MPAGLYKGNLQEFILILELLTSLFRKDDDENFEETHMYWVRNEDENETCLCEVNLS